VQETVGTATAVLLGVGVAALGLSAAAAFLLDGLAPPSLQQDFRFGMLGVGVAMLIRFPCTAYMAALEGYQRYDLSNAAWIVTTVVASLGAVVAVEAGTGVLGVTLAYALAIVASAIATAIFLRRVDPGLSLRPRIGERAARRHLLHFSSFALLADSMVFVGQRMDVVVIAAIRNAGQAGPYAAAVKLQSGVQSLVLPFVELLMPMVSDLWSRGARDEVRERFTLATRIAVQVTLPVAVGIALFSRDLVDLWLGPSAPDVTVAIVVVLMAVQVLTLSFAAAEKVLVGVGRVRAMGALACVEGGANVALSIVLVSAYGAIGAAIGTLVTSAVVSPLKLPLACRAIGLPLARFLRHGLLVGVGSSLPAAVAMATVWLVLAPGLGRFALGFGVGLAAAAVVGASQLGRDRLARGFDAARLRRRPTALRDPLDSDALDTPGP